MIAVGVCADQPSLPPLFFVKLFDRDLKWDWRLRVSKACYLTSVFLFLFIFHDRPAYPPTMR
jgi:hypothetical protein